VNKTIQALGVKVPSPQQAKKASIEIPFSFQIRNHEPDVHC
jgi:hypothetical protein